MLEEQSAIRASFNSPLATSNTVSDLPGLRELWAKTTGDARVCVAVLDGPVDLSHPCFVGAHLADLETLFPNTVGDDPATQHGTHVASLVFGRHGGPVPGVAPNCSGLILPIYSPRRAGTLACSQLDLARAINQAVIHGANIINISGGELDPGGEADPLLAQAIRRCSDDGVLIVAATGNNSCACLHIPAAVPSVLAVGAMKKDGSALESSNWGAAYQEQGVLALGENILGAAPGGGAIPKTGTSFAAALVTGVAALLMSAQLKRGDVTDGGKVRAAILGSAEPCDFDSESDCRRVLVGRLNIAAAHARLFGEAINTLAADRYSVGAPVSSGGWHLSYTAAGNVFKEVTGRITTALLEGAPFNLNSQPFDKEKYMSDQKQAVNDISNRGGSASTEVPGVIAGGLVGTKDFSMPIGPDVPPPVNSGSVPAVVPSEVQAAECAACAQGHGTCKSCAENNASTPALAYVLGQIGYDFGTEARRDQFAQLASINPYDPTELLAYLEKDPASAANIIWTLSLDATVAYAVAPFGPFAGVGYERLREALNAQLTEDADRVSVPGYIKGSVNLMNGQAVPVIYADIRGIFSWSTPVLVKASLGSPPKEKKAAEAHALQTEGVHNFLERVYYELRNLGMTPQDRAMNYAATNAFQLEFIYNHAVANNLRLDTIDVERSPICRPGSDCWDVKLIFFNPSQRLEQARHVYRFTVDVSEAIPVTVGKVRHWEIY